MFLDTRTECPKSLKIWLPHLTEPISARKVEKKYPEFAALFDGKAKENTLFFYYKINKEEQCLDFIDEEAEEEVAELLGVTITEIELEDEEEAKPISRSLSEQEINDFRSHINDIRHGLDAIRITALNENQKMPEKEPPGPDATRWEVGF
jgi:hypothetical protein